MTSDEMARAIRIAERAYKRVLSQRNNSWEWASAIAEAAIRLGQLRLESWQFTGGKDETVQMGAGSYKTERNSDDHPAVPVGAKPKRAGATRMVLARTAHRSGRVRP